MLGKERFFEFCDAMTGNIAQVQQVGAEYKEIVGRDPRGSLGV
jgi:hypothetical protein